MKTTPAPRIDLLKVIPELKGEGQTTIRLHPRQAKNVGITESKIGGLFCWPKDESWPVCESTEPPDWSEKDWDVPEGASVPLVPVLQLAAKDFPTLEFYPGTDLLQLLWCPLAHDAPIFVARPFLRWRSASAVKQTMTKIPTSKYADPAFVPPECRLHPEAVVEFPRLEFLSEALRKQIISLDVSDVVTEDDDSQTAEELYAAELSVAPGTKVGGFVRWVQAPETPKCENGHVMSHLLTIGGTEFDWNMRRRWCPEEDRSTIEGDDYDAQALVQSPAFGRLGGEQFIFICRNCPDWPIASVFQR